MKILKVVLLDSSYILRKGIEALLKRLSGYKLQLTEVENPAFLHDTMKKKSPDWLIVNPIHLSHQELISIKEEETGLKIIALPLSVADLSVQSGFDEVLNIYEAEDDLLNRLRNLAEKDDEQPQENEVQQVLSAREKEIVVYVVKGMTNREIADLLFLSTHTVITHRRNIARKLQIRSASGLTIYAIVNKLVQLDEVEHLIDKE